MVDPRNEAQLEELSFASGCVIAPHALPEFRFVQLMQRFYRVGASVRFRTLLDENQRARQMREHTRARQVQASAPEAPKRDLPIEPLPADFELTDEEAFNSAPVVQAPRLPAPPSPRGLQPASAAAAAPLVTKAASAPPLAKPSEAAPIPPTAAQSPLPALATEPALEVDEPALPAPRPAPKRDAALATSLAALERVVIESGERGEVIDASLALAGRFTDVAAIFVVREGVAAGLCGTRGGAPLDVESTLLPLAGEGLATSAARDHKPAIGAPNAALDKLFAKALRLRDDAELGVFPVLIGDRVANLVVAQCAGERFPKLAEAALRALAWLLGQAYERLIRIQKQKSALPASPAAAPATKGTLGALPLQKRVVRVDATKS
jgi:hypothetical protein